MNYSAPSELPHGSSGQARDALGFVVFTNSGDDYRVTARSQGPRLVRTEELADKIARACGDSAAAVPTIVAIFPCPDRPGMTVGLRVFDAGIFRNRPHTLALVMVTSPGEECWPGELTRVLAALVPPQPGAFDYRLPSALDIGTAQVREEPFESMSAAEQSQRKQRLETPIVFSTSAKLADEVRELLRVEPLRHVYVPRRRTVIASIALLLVLTLAVGAALVWRLFSRRDGGVPESKVQPYNRDKLVGLLIDSRVRISPGMNYRAAAAAVTETANTIKDRLKSLADELTIHSQEPARDSEPTLRHYLRLWEKDPLAASDLPSMESPNSAELENAFRIHQKCKEVLNSVKRLEEFDPEGTEFNRELASLRDLLAK